MSARSRTLTVLTLVLVLIVGCGRAGPTTTPVPPLETPTLTPTATPTSVPEATSQPADLSAEEAATLDSLEQVDGYPLYTMHYYADYRASSSLGVAYGREDSLARDGEPSRARLPAWACSLFAALGDEGNMLYGRNFDWNFSPALLLFTDPPDGYASVSMVDIAYLGFGGLGAQGITDLPLDECRSLLDAPFLPFDGMNEQGLAVGMAAVPAGGMRSDPDKETIDSLGVIRQILDHAGSADEAVAILESYNIAWGSGPPLHYLVADRSGHALLVEFYEGEMVVTPNETPWHQATNFLRASAGESADGQCWRYDKIGHSLSAAAGRLGREEAMDLLAQVSQSVTQWSIVYGMSGGDIDVVMGQRYDSLHTFHLNPAAR